jgi:hypothetical protein
MNNIDPLTLSLRHFNRRSNNVYYYYTTHLNNINTDEIVRIKVNILQKRAFELRFNFLFKMIELKTKISDEFYIYIESDDLEELYRKYQ